MLCKNMTVKVHYQNRDKCAVSCLPLEYGRGENGINSELYDLLQVNL